MAEPKRVNQEDTYEAFIARMDEDELREQSELSKAKNLLDTPELLGALDEVIILAMPELGCHIEYGRLTWEELSELSKLEDRDIRNHRELVIRLSKPPKRTEREVEESLAKLPGNWKIKILNEINESENRFLLPLKVLRKSASSKQDPISTS